MNITDTRFLIDSYLRMARTTTDEDARRRYVEKAEKLLHDMEECNAGCGYNIKKLDACKNDLEQLVAENGGCLSMSELHDILSTQYSSPTIRRAKEALTKSGYSYKSTGHRENKKWYFCCPNFEEVADEQI